LGERRAFLDFVEREFLAALDRRRRFDNDDSDPARAALSTSMRGRLQGQT
jgi:hypothetical protein